jgi:hypothetical protein
MPLTAKGNEIKSNMEKEYGAKKGESVFYASKNAGTISGVDTQIHQGLPTAGMFTSRPQEVKTGAIQTPYGSVTGDGLGFKK